MDKMKYCRFCGKLIVFDVIDNQWYHKTTSTLWTYCGDAETFVYNKKGKAAMPGSFKDYYQQIPDYSSCPKP